MCVHEFIKPGFDEVHMRLEGDAVFVKDHSRFKYIQRWLSIRKYLDDPVVVPGTATFRLADGVQLNFQNIFDTFYGQDLMHYIAKLDGLPQGCSCQLIIFTKAVSQQWSFKYPVTGNAWGHKISKSIKPSPR